MSCHILAFSLYAAISLRYWGKFQTDILPTFDINGKK